MKFMICTYWNDFAVRNFESDCGSTNYEDFWLNFKDSEKATNFCEISTVDLSYVVTVKCTGRFRKIFGLLRIYELWRCDVRCLCFLSIVCLLGVILDPQTPQTIGHHLLMHVPLKSFLTKYTLYLFKFYLMSDVGVLFQCEVKNL